MSYELYAIFDQDRLPSREVWQSAIKAEGFPLELFDSLDWAKVAGFFPCRLSGKPAGFELHRSTRQDMLHGCPKLETKMKPKDIGVVFVFGGNVLEAQSAIIASAVLVRITSGLWFDPQEEQVVQADQSIAKARQYLAAFAKNG